MFELSKRARLALSMLVELAREPASQRSNEELAAALQVSGHHLSKVAQTLARAGWIAGTRGKRGGYRMLADPKRISMADVIELFEGVRALPACRRTAATDCEHDGARAIQTVVAELEEQAYYTLKSVTVSILARRAESPACSPSAPRP